MEYLLNILVVALIGGILAESFNLLGGYSGMLSTAQGAISGIGAYTAGILVTRVNVGLPAVLCATVATGALTGFVLARSTSGLRNDLFAVGTLAFQMVLVGLFSNLTPLTGGAMGIKGIPPPVLFGMQFAKRSDFCLLVVIVTGVVVLSLAKIANSSFGRILKAIREDETLAHAFGKNVAKTRDIAAIVSGSIAAVAGMLYAYYTTYIDPSAFTVNESIFVIAASLVGGLGTIAGPMLGAIALVTLPELLRFVGIPSAPAANIRQIIYGLVLVTCMLWRPQGLIGEHARRKWARQK